MDLLEEVFDANNFKINEESIGEGKYGKVHIAVRQSDSIKFAVKIIPHSSNDPDIEKNILRESSILRSIQHPSILKFIGLTITTNETKIFTELLPNGSLKDKLYGHDDDFTTTKKYIALIGISDAMRYLHEHNIIHRDLKPENIMIDEIYQPRLCDFGLSRILPDELTRSKNCSLTVGIGTCAYMSPEMLDDSLGKYDKTVDVYAFGIMLNEIFSGKKPFSESKMKSIFQLSNHVIHGQRPSLASNVSEVIEKLIKRCWSQTISNRPHFDEIFEILTSDLSYIKENVNKEEIEQYINFLKEEREKEKEKKKNVSVNDDDDDDEKFVIYEDKKFIRYKLYEKSQNAEVIDSQKVNDEVIIPSFIKFGPIEYNVTKICDKAFANSAITKLKFSSKSHVNSIGNNAFKNSTIKEIFLPESLTELKPFWIKGANRLEKVDVDEENTCFSSKDEFLFRNNVKEIIFASRKFKGDFSVSKEITRIGDFSFSNIQGIQSFESNISKLSGIGSYSFFNCENLRSFIYKHVNQNLTLFNFCFSNCKNLSTVEIQCNEFISLNNCFYNCKSIELLKISAKSVELHPETFKGCTRLQKIIFHNSNEVNISKDNFFWPGGFKSVSFIKVKNVILGPQLFYKVKSLEEIEIKDSFELTIGDECFSLSGIKNIQLDSKLINLSKNFASKCSMLTNIDINCIQNIAFSENSFKESNSIENISIKTDSKLTASENFLSNSNNLYKVTLSGKKEVYIGNNSFNECKTLSFFEIPNSGDVTFGENNFVNCEKLEKVQIESSEKSKVMFGSNCFSQCDLLNELYIKSGKLITKNINISSNQSLSHLSLMDLDELIIENDQFSGSKLESAIFESKSKIILGTKCFSNSINLQIVSFSSAKDKLIDVNIFDECFSNCTKLEKVTFGNLNNHNLCSNLFTMCTELKSIQIEVIELLTIKKNCFLGSNLEEIYLRAGNIEIEEESCINNQSLKSISINANDILIKSNSFAQNKNLQKLIIDANSHLVIGEGCFSNSTNLNSLTINGNSINILNFCFNSCNKLKSILITNSNNVLFGENVFTGCNNIESITITAQNYFKANKNCFSSLGKLNLVQITSNLVCLGIECFANCGKLINFFITAKQIDFDKCCFSSCSYLNSVDCSSSDLITYFNTSFNGKNHENFIKSNNNTSFEERVDDDKAEDKSRLLRLLKSNIFFH